MDGIHPPGTPLRRLSPPLVIASLERRSVEALQAARVPQPQISWH